MIEITSKNNQAYKAIQKLTSKKYRDREGSYLIEGENLIQEAINNDATIEAVFIRDDKANDFDLGEELEEVTYIVSGGLFDDLAQTETSQGILAKVKKPNLSLSSLSPDSIPGNIVVLDSLQDPGNIGTIIRTADAAGYSLIITVKGTCDAFSPKVVRSAAGSLFRIPIVKADSDEELLNFLNKSGKRIVSTVLDGDVDYYDANLKRDIAFIVGNEGNGIRDELKEKTDVKVKIPMKGKTESLNAAVAAAIIMYESVRK